MTLEADEVKPVGTMIKYYTRSGKSASPDATWSAWSEVNSPIPSPNGRYVQYKAVLSTTNEDQTPTVRSVTINYEDLSKRPPLQEIVVGVDDPIDEDSTPFHNLEEYLRVRGVSVPGAQISISIVRLPRVCTTIADDLGEWTCTFTEKIEDAGNYTVEVTATDSEGVVLSATTFELLVGYVLPDTGDPAILSIMLGSGLLATLFVLRRKVWIFD